MRAHPRGTEESDRAQVEIRGSNRCGNSGFGRGGVLSAKRSAHPLTYCTNIHPGESWTQVFSQVSRHVLRVKEAVSPDATFPVGLRLSHRAVEDLDAEASARFKAWCDEHGCTIATLNGFPYGRFHGVRVKEAVYLPDWRSSERVTYTHRLADLLASWLPPSTRGSISTVPLGFREALSEGDLPGIRQNLTRSLEHLDQVAQTTGKDILLSLEPEPGCALETTPDVVRFFSSLDLPAHLRGHLAVCYDCCHQALQFEDPAASLRLLAEHEIALGHVQVSSALHLAGGDLRRLELFEEPVYLHQTVGRFPDGRLLRFRDLPDALSARPRGALEWRVHFHVPVFLEELPGCRSTQEFLRGALPLFPVGTPLEVETYTWSVLPPELQTGSVTESIIREIQWTAEHRWARGAGDPPLEQDASGGQGEPARCVASRSAAGPAGDRAGGRW